MDLPWTALLLWMAGFLGNSVLLSVLLYKRRFRVVPWFTLWIGTEMLFSATEFLAYRYGFKHLYRDIYWTYVFVDVILQIAVVLEIAAKVLRRSDHWVPEARLRLSLFAAVAPLAALIMAWLMQPAASTPLDAWAARVSLFSTVLIFILFIAVVAASRQLGLGWRSYTMRESYGFFLWVMVAFLTDTLHAYWRTAEHFTFLENARIVVFQAAILYWIVVFWLPEPVNESLNRDDVKYLTEVKSRLEYSQQSSKASSTGGVAPQ